MADGRAWKDQAEAFLRGEPGEVSFVQRAVSGAVRSFGFAHGDVERDLIQEALSRTIASLQDGQFQGEASVATYARNIARYTCLQHIRRRRNEVAVDPETLPAGARWAAPEAAYFSDEEHRRNLEAFASLSPACQEILRMICLERASYREVASRLGITEASLKSRIHRCRLTCREAARSPLRPLRAILEKESS